MRISVEELLQRYEKGERDFAGAYISEAILSWANLTEADLSRASLAESSLYEANLTNAKMTETSLGAAPCLTGANLTNVDLSSTWIDLPDGIENPRVAGAIFCNTTMPDGTKIRSFF